MSFPESSFIKSWQSEKNLESRELPRNINVYFVRHAQANYLNEERELLLDNSKFVGNQEKPSSQLLRDLTSEGVQVAQETARDFFEKLRSEKEREFYVVSSRLPRSLETAEIFVREGDGQGFIFHEYLKSSEWKITADKRIRIMEPLSLPHYDPFIYSVFNPQDFEPEINWDAESSKKNQEYWHQARDFVLKNDQGSWSKNYHMYGKYVQEKYFDDLKTTRDLHGLQFNYLIKLLRRMQLTDDGLFKTVLAFGHEDYMMQALENHFSDPHLENCQILSVGSDGYLSKF